jgi:hypothetical protein
VPFLPVHSSGDTRDGAAPGPELVPGMLVARCQPAVTDSPHDRPWGIYSGYFQDPDGHLWEIIWNPALDLAPS